MMKMSYLTVVILYLLLLLVNNSYKITKVEDDKTNNRIVAKHQTWKSV